MSQSDNQPTVAGKADSFLTTMRREHPAILLAMLDEYLTNLQRFRASVEDETKGRT